MLVGWRPDALRERLQDEQPDAGSGASDTAADVSAPPVARGDQTGRVGLFVATNTRTWNKQLDAQEVDGVAVLLVQPDGPSGGAGLEPGDVITAVNGEPSYNVDQAVFRQLRAVPGTDLVFDVATKGGGTKTATVTAREPGTVDYDALFQPFLDANPDDAVVWFLRAQTEGRTFNDALADAEKAIELSPGFVEAIAFRAELLWGRTLGNQVSGAEKDELRDRALNDWDLALDLDPDNLRALVSRARALADLGSPAPGKADAEKAIEMDEHYASAYGALGLAEYRLARYGSAARATRKALDLNPYDIRYYEILAASFMQLGRQEDAQKTVDAIIDLVPVQAARERLLAIPQAGARGSSGS